MIHDRPIHHQHAIKSVKAAVAAVVCLTGGVAFGYLFATRLAQLDAQLAVVVLIFAVLSLGAGLSYVVSVFESVHYYRVTRPESE